LQDNERTRAQIPFLENLISFAKTAQGFTSVIPDAPMHAEIPEFLLNPVIDFVYTQSPFLNLHLQPGLLSDGTTRVNHSGPFMDYLNDDEIQMLVNDDDPLFFGLGYGHLAEILSTNCSPVSFDAGAMTEDDLRLQNQRSAEYMVSMLNAFLHTNGDFVTSFLPSIGLDRKNLIKYFGEHFVRAGIFDPPIPRDAN
jgi:hypothetical protein